MKTVAHFLLLLVISSIYSPLFAQTPEEKKAMVEGLLETRRERLNLETDTETVGGYEMFYLDNEKKNKDALVLIHGLGGDSMQWTSLAEYMSGYRIIIPDLVGFGQSEKPTDANASYQLQTQAERVLELLDEIGVDEYHVVGNSMGGAIAAVMAVLAPEKVKTLSLFNAAGAYLYQSQWMMDYVNGEGNVMLTNNRAEFDQMIDIAFYREPAITMPVLDYMADQEIANSATKAKIIKEINTGEYANLALHLPKIQAPTLVLWGKEDGVIHYRNADVFEWLIPNAQKVIFDEVGHLPMYERPKLTSDALKAFLKANSSN